MADVSDLQHFALHMQIWAKFDNRSSVTFKVVKWDFQVQMKREEIILMFIVEYQL